MAPTVSYTNVVLGRLPTELLGGDMRLDRDASVRAIQPVADKLGISLEAAALGIVQIVNANMMRAIRAVSIERGHDPRPFVLMPFGGARALHAIDLAGELGMRAVLVPPSPGILCAQGLVVANLKESFVATCRTPLAGDLGHVRVELARLDTLVREWWRMEQIRPEEARRKLVIDMRYTGQNYELGVAVPEMRGDGLPPAAELARLFYATHERSYGHHNVAAPIEIVNLRVSGIGRLPDIGAPQFARRAAVSAQRTRPVWFSGEGPVESRVYWRPDLAPGTEIDGPAIVEQLDATTTIPPVYRAVVDAGLNLVIGAAS